MSCFQRGLGGTECSSPGASISMYNHPCGAPSASGASLSEHAAHRSATDQNRFTPDEPADGTQEHTRLLNLARPIKLASAAHSSNMCLLARVAYQQG